MSAHIQRMADQFAKYGWMVEAIVLQGPSEKMVHHFMVARETKPEVIAAVLSFPGIYPEDEISSTRRLSQAEIERAQLKIDEVRLYLPH
jgi:hypothetical protein